ncbi:MAG: phosphatase PAP2 family protein [Prevotella sp.]|nr:phosphatase PAP2 family protein [Prevotella sp.]
MDEQLFFLINSNHTVFWDSMMYCISQKTVWVPFYLSIVYVILRNYSWRELAVVLLMIGCGMLVTDWGNAHLLRPWIGRLRPSNPDNPISSLVHIVNDRRGAGCGFPSAHSANIWLVTFVVCYWLRNRLIQITMPTVALLVCYSRVYLGFHYPGDILGGFVLAAVVAWTAIKLQQRYGHILCASAKESGEGAGNGKSSHNIPRKEGLRECFVVPVVVGLTLIAFCFVSVS